mgnify:CR=1 FL=1|jgi:methanogenic corrinoid protein MtbC1
MILESQYLHYLAALTDGNKEECTRIILSLLESGVSVKEIYTDVIKRSMYRIGQLWENDRTSIAREHQATKITEIIINLIYPHILSVPKINKKVIVTCTDKEFHELGARMVSDVFELNGWHSIYLGANTPKEELLTLIEEEKPDIVAISLNFYINIVRLMREIEAINEKFPTQKIIVGGQAFSEGKEAILQKFENVKYISCIYTLEDYLKSLN